MKKRIISLALVLILAFSLLPTGALAASSKIYDVYQGDGFYITVKPFALKSNKYTFNDVLDGLFHDGMLAVCTADVDENYVNRVFVNEFNYADKDGNILFPAGIFHKGWQNADISGLFPSEGMIPYWDGKSDDGTNILMGFVDYSGKVVIPCKYRKNTAFQRWIKLL